MAKIKKVSDKKTKKGGTKGKPSAVKTKKPGMFK